MKLTDDLQGKIELILNRRLAKSEEGNVAAFMDFTDSDCKEIALLGSKSGVLAISYIRFRMKDGIALNLVVSYYGTVIQQGVPAEEWAGAV